MMWKIMHWILGWDYVSFRYGCQGDNMIRRIKITPNGQEYFQIYDERVFMNGARIEYRHLTRAIGAPEETP